MEFEATTGMILHLADAIVARWAEVMPGVEKALDYYRLMHSQGHDVDKYYKE